MLFGLLFFFLDCFETLGRVPDAYGPASRAVAQTTDPNSTMQTAGHGKTPGRVDGKTPGRVGQKTKYTDFVDIC